MFTPYPKKFADLYDELAVSYYDYSKSLTVLQKIVSNRKDLLEVGVGTGVMALALSKVGFSVTGIDPAVDMLNLAKQKCAGTGITLIESDCLQYTPQKPHEVIFSQGGFPVYIRDTKQNYLKSEMLSKTELHDYFRWASETLTPDGLLVNSIHGMPAGIIDKDFGANHEYHYTRDISYEGDMSYKTLTMTDNSTGEVIAVYKMQQRLFPYELVCAIANQYGLTASTNNFAEPASASTLIDAYCVFCK